MKYRQNSIVLCKLTYQFNHFSPESAIENVPHHALPYAMVYGLSCVRLI